MHCTSVNCGCKVYCTPIKCMISVPRPGQAANARCCWRGLLQERGWPLSPSHVPPPCTPPPPNLPICPALQVRGALVNAVKPELLLDEDDLDRVLTARAEGAASAEDEEALEALQLMEAAWEMHSVQAWNTVLLQVRSTSLGFRVWFPGVEHRAAAGEGLQVRSTSMGFGGVPWMSAQ